MPQPPPPSAVLTERQGSDVRLIEDGVLSDAAPLERGANAVSAAGFGDARASSSELEGHRHIQDTGASQLHAHVQSNPSAP